MSVKSLMIGSFAFLVSFATAAERRISVEDYRDRMQAAWIGQIAGVTWGFPTEFKFNGVIVPSDKVPAWRPETMNDGFDQDDLYVEMTFLRSLEQYGLDVSIRQAGLDFANSKYMLWCANKAGRDNLRRGIAPPDSSHPQFNKCPNDIDYQIEADFSGIIAPGMPNAVIKMANTFGRLMNYGDGVLGGIFIGAMYAEGYFTTDRMKVIEAGLAAIPPESDYAKIVRQVCAWYHEDPNDWEACLRKIEKEFRDDTRKFKMKDTNGDIDVRLNGAILVMGILYGKDDLDQTIVIAMRGGYDSDCNPSSAAGPIFEMVGYNKLPARFTEKLIRTGRKFSYTAYDFEGLLAVSEKLTRQIIIREGGRIEKDAAGKEWFIIPDQKPHVGKYLPSWEATPPENSRFTPEEMSQMKL